MLRNAGGRHGDPACLRSIPFRRRRNRRETRASFPRQDLGLHRHQWGLDLYRVEDEVASHLVAKQGSRSQRQQTDETLWSRWFLSRMSVRLMLHQPDEPPSLHFSSEHRPVAYNLTMVGPAIGGRHFLARRWRGRPAQVPPSSTHARGNRSGVRPSPAPTRGGQAIEKRHGPGARHPTTEGIRNPCVFDKAVR